MKISPTLRGETISKATTTRNPKTTTSFTVMSRSSIVEILPPKTSGTKARKKTTYPRTLTSETSDMEYPRSPIRPSPGRWPRMAAASGTAEFDAMNGQMCARNRVM